MEFAFVANNLALDFVATVAARDTVAEEKLVTTGDLARWLLESGVVTVPPEVFGSDLDAAVALREAIYRALRQRSANRPPARADRELINAVAGRPDPALSLADDGSVQRTGNAPEAMSAIARAAVIALDPARAELRWCAGADCTRPFLDTSRAGSRRWCGMAGCGDRAKAAAYRRRKRTAALPG